VLALPWGFEIYGAAHALESAQHPPPAGAAYDTGRKVLVVGLGPGGLHAGAPPDERRPSGRRHRRAEDRAADPALSGIARRARAACRSRCATSRLFEDLDERVLAGFGGVAEYGITVRWDKNFLKLIRLTAGAARVLRDVRRRALRRHADASTDAWALGFDHVALCMGAGQAHGHRHAKNNLARGVRQASATS
jgi:NADPH-dependent glutamate synthase beta subunit-like oxidoreductase